MKRSVLVVWLATFVGFVKCTVFNATWSPAFSTLIAIGNSDKKHHNRDETVGSWEYDLNLQSSRMDFIDTNTFEKTTYIWDWEKQVRYEIKKPFLSEETCTYCSIPSSSHQLFLNVSNLAFQQKEWKDEVWCSNYYDSTRGIEFWEDDKYKTPVRIEFSNNDENDKKPAPFFKTEVPIFNLGIPSSQKIAMEKKPHQKRDTTDLVFKNYYAGKQPPHIFDIPDGLQCVEDGPICSPILPNGVFL